MHRKILLFTHCPYFLKTVQFLFSPQTCIISHTNRVDFAYDLLNKAIHDLVIINHDSRFQIDTLELTTFCHLNQYQARVLVVINTPSSQLTIQCLRSGADEVVTYPLPAEELKLRVEHLLLFQKQRPLQELSFGRLKIIPQQGLVLADETRIPLRKREFQILLCLLKFSNSVVTREMMIDSLWGEDVPMYSTIDSYIRRLRLLIKAELLTIKTVRGFGYMAVPAKVSEPLLKYPRLPSKEH